MHAKPLGNPGRVAMEERETNLKLSDQQLDDMLAFLFTLTDGWSDSQ